MTNDQSMTNENEYPMPNMDRFSAVFRTCWALDHLLTLVIDWSLRHWSLVILPAARSSINLRGWA
jgi:hypothetical protein